jgi:HK97 family phage prohead protease
MHIKSYQAQFKALDEAAEGAGVFEALVAVFNNVDRMGDKILPGAFAKSLGRWKASGDPPLSMRICGTILTRYSLWLEAREDDEGLYIKAQLTWIEHRGGVWKRMRVRVLKAVQLSYDVVDGKQRTAFTS